MKSIQRTFLPGCQWVYIKLYTGNKIADDMLIQVISPVIKELKKKTYIDKWFFIRYTDPDFHLRIRLWVIDVQYIGEIICLFQKKFINLHRPIKNRSTQLIPVVQQINEKRRRNTEIDRNELLSSYLHMMIDRLFRSKNRLYELILYDFMRVDITVVKLLEIN